MRSNSLIEFCRSLPHVTEDIKWGHDLVFSIGGKMFAVFDLENPAHVAFKTTSEMFSTLSAVEGVIPAPYLARFNWIAVRKNGALPLKMLKGLLAESHGLVHRGLPAAVRKKLARKKD